MSGGQLVDSRDPHGITITSWFFTRYELRIYRCIYAEKMRRSHERFMSFIELPGYSEEIRHSSEYTIREGHKYHDVRARFKECAHEGDLFFHTQYRTGGESQISIMLLANVSRVSLLPPSFSQSTVRTFPHTHTDNTEVVTACQSFSTTLSKICRPT